MQSVFADCLIYGPAINTQFLICELSFLRYKLSWVYFRHSLSACNRPSIMFSRWTVFKTIHSQNSCCDIQKCFFKLFGRTFKSCKVYFSLIYAVIFAFVGRVGFWKGELWFIMVSYVPAGLPVNFCCDGHSLKDHILPDRFEHSSFLKLIK